MKSYTHNQTTPSTDWVITHNLDSYPVSDVIIDDADKRWKTLPLALEYINANTVLVRFSNPMTGTVRLVGAYRFELNPVDPDIPVEPGTDRIVTAGWPQVASSGITYTSMSDLAFDPANMIANPNISSVSYGDNVKPQRIIVTFTSPTEYDVVGSYNGAIGSGVLFHGDFTTMDHVFRSAIVQFSLNNYSGAPIEAGDTLHFDIAYLVNSDDFSRQLQDLQITTTPDTPAASEMWTVTIDGLNFTVVGSVSGPQPNGTLFEPYSNDFMSFMLPGEDGVDLTGQAFNFSLSSVTAAQVSDPFDVFVPVEPIVGDLVSSGTPFPHNITPSRAGTGQFSVSNQYPDGWSAASTATVRPQHFTILMTSPTEYTVTASLDGFLGTGALSTDFVSDIVSFALYQNPSANEGAVDFQTGDTYEFDLSYIAFSSDYNVYMADIVIKPSVVPNSPQSTEKWTVTFDTPTTFTVVGSVSGPQPSGVVDVRYENDYIGFFQESYGVTVGAVVEVQLANVIATIHEEPLPLEEPAVLSRTPIFRDTFNGPVANLVGRVPDIGPAWGYTGDYPSFLDFAGGADATALARVGVDGAGGMWYINKDDQYYNLALPKMMPPYGYFEYKFVINSLPSDGYVNLFYNGAVDVPLVNGVADENNWANLGASIELNVNGSGGANGPFFELAYAGSNDYTPAGFRNEVVGMTPVVGVEYTWTWESGPAGLIMTLSDGTTTIRIMTDHGARLLPNWEDTAFALGDSGPGPYWGSYMGEGNPGYTSVAGAPARITSFELGTLTYETT